jgi:hypothetical protein
MSVMVAQRSRVVLQICDRALTVLWQPNWATDAAKKSAKLPSLVIPAKAGIQFFVCASRAGFRLAPE